MLVGEIPKNYKYLNKTSGVPCSYNNIVKSWIKKIISRYFSENQGKNQV